MIYLLGLIIGVLNGLFAAGAGQILVFYLIFLKKIETHIARTISVSVISISSIVSAVSYKKIVNINFKLSIILIIISLISGFIGGKIMKKIPSNILNLIAGILISFLSIYKFLS